MRVLSALLLLCISFLLFNCGDNNVENGRQAYNEGDYNQAIQLLTSAKRDKVNESSIDELIVLSYMHRGMELYNKTQNLKSFTGNYNSALKHFPDNPSAKFKSEYDDLLIELARAYKEAKPRNETEHEQNFTKSIDLLNKVLHEDSTKIAAKELFGEIEKLIFQKYLDKATALYNKARKTKDWDLFFVAESYLLDSEKFNPENKEIVSLKRKIRRETLGVLNYRDGVSLAVTERMYEKGKLIMYLVVKNYNNKPVKFNPEDIELVDIKGTEYAIDKEEMRVRELFGQIPIKSAILDRNNPSTEGVIAFETPKDLAISYINFSSNGEEISRKYFR